MTPEAKETGFAPGTTGLSRSTKEASIGYMIHLDGTGVNETHAGIGFFDHMLMPFSLHSGADLTLHVDDDLQVYDHHTVEGCSIAMGAHLKETLQDKRGVGHYGSMLLPMDETLAQVVLDISGRSFLVYNCELEWDTIGSFSHEMMEESLRVFTFQAGITLYINIMYGTNDHHKVGAIFKALGYALKMAICAGSDTLSSIKGRL